MNARMDENETRERHPLRSASLSGGAVPSRVLLTPWGRVETTNGTFVVDEESAALSAAAFDEHGADLPIDYEHQTLGGAYASPTGQAPAAGWIKRLTAEPGVGLLADIEWTEPARAQLAGKQYRYLSPVAIVRKSDRKLVAIHSAALTNKPAIVGMTPIVNQAAAVGSDVSEEPLAALRRELNLAEEAGTEEVLAAAGQRLGQLDRDARRRRVEERVAEAVQAGKLVEAQRAWAQELARREEELFDEWMKTAPIVVPIGVTIPPRRGDAARPGHAAVSARAEFRANRLLAALTSEEAYVTDALRRTA